MSDKKRKTIVTWLVILCIVVSLGIWWAFLVGSTAFIYGLGVFNLAFGPACLIFYLIEVRKGVFAGGEEEAEME